MTERTDEKFEEHERGHWYCDGTTFYVRNSDDYGDNAEAFGVGCDPTQAYVVMDKRLVKECHRFYLLRDTVTGIVHHLLKGVVEV